MRCDQCQMATINGMPCHEHGCPNRKSRWDAESEAWVKQRTCSTCGERVDADDPCCSADADAGPDYDEPEHASARDLYPSDCPDRD